MIITLKGANFSDSNIGTLSTWRINRSLGTGATYEGPTSVDKGAALSATVTLAENYAVGTAGVTITMGTAVLSDAYSISGQVITITIAAVTANVTIKVPTINTSTGEEEEPETPQTLTLYKSNPDNGLFLLDYQNKFSLSANSTSISGKFQIIATDISNHIGKVLSITATQAVIDGAYYAFFTSELLGGYTLDKILTLTQNELPETASSGRTHTLSASAIIEKFVVSVESQKTNTLEKTIPVGTKYLYLTNLTVEQTSEPAVVLI